LIEVQRDIVVLNLGQNVLIFRYIAAIGGVRQQCARIGRRHAAGGNGITGGTDDDVARVALGAAVVGTAAAGLIGSEETSILAVEIRMIGIFESQAELPTAPVMPCKHAEAVLFIVVCPAFARAHFNALDVAPQNQIRNAGDGIGSVRRGGAIGNNVHPLQHYRGKGVRIDRAAAGPGGGHPVTVEQGERRVGAQAA
jgi:hypothetical protein